MRRSRFVQTLNVEEEFRKHWRGFSVRHESCEGRTASRSAVGTSSGFHSLRLCWTDLLSIPQGQFLLPVRWFFPQARIKTLQVLRAALGPVLDE